MQSHGSLLKRLRQTNHDRQWTGIGSGTGQIFRAGTHEFQTYQQTTDWIHSPSVLTKNGMIPDPASLPRHAQTLNIGN